MRSRLIVGCGLFALVARVASAQSTAAPDTAAVRREIEVLSKEMEAAFSRGDLRAVAAFYADNAVIRSAHEVAAAGRGAIDEYFASVPSPKSWKLDMYSATAAPSGGLVYHTGMSTLVFGSPERTSRFQFVMVWQRQPPNTLRIVLFYYHVPEPTQ